MNHTTLICKIYKDVQLLEQNMIRRSCHMINFNSGKRAMNEQPSGKKASFPAQHFLQLGPKS